MLNAFAGVFAAIGEHMPKGVVCRWPAAFLDLALLWTPVKAWKRREEESVIRGDAFAFLSCTEPQARYPSWSWASWIGPVEYRLFLEEERKRPLPVPMAVDGFRGCHNARMVSIANDKGDGQQVVLEVEDVDSDSDTLVDCGPNVLPFNSPVIPATAFTRGKDIKPLCHQGEAHSTGDQGVYRLYDREGEHCGLCFEPMIPVDNSLPQFFFVGIAQPRRDWCAVQRAE